MRDDIYKPDELKKQSKYRFKKNMTDLEKMEVYTSICEMARAYIKQKTEGFLKNFQDKDRFQFAVSQEIIKTFPQPYLNAFLKRIDRLSTMAESRGYTVQFAKWKTTKEYSWVFIRK